MEASPPPDPRASPAVRAFRVLTRAPAAISDRQLGLLFAVALAALFEEYDIAMLTSALRYIAADLAIAEGDLPDLLAVIRLGAVPAFAFIPYADRVGRRRVFLSSVLAMGVLTVLTSFAQGPWDFVVLQMLTRTFFVAGTAIAFVYIAEEFPAEHRGFGIGLLGAIAVSGHGLSAVLFSGINHLPHGWRLLYAVGGVPVLLFPWLARRIPETARFAAASSAMKVGAFSWLGPLRELLTLRPRRALGVALAGVLPTFGIIGTFQFSGYYTQSVRGWSPQQYAVMVVAAGAFGVVGNVSAGRLADRFGRRAVGAALLAAFPLAATLFYRGSDRWLPFAWAAAVFASQGGRAILRAQATELFPTAMRGAASGVFTVLDVLGAAFGLFVLGRMLEGGASLPAAIPLVAAVTVGGALVVLAFPETSGRELEQID
ncbi:MAG: MFS transporter [Deltaproteobacteria bacterium]|nr:MFS transporter [Deltaproteobacteria bacterium]